MPRHSWELISARTWYAKSPERRYAELQFELDRHRNQNMKEQWKTTKQYALNDLANAVDGTEIMSKYGLHTVPSPWSMGMFSPYNNLSYGVPGHLPAPVAPVVPLAPPMPPVMQGPAVMAASMGSSMINEIPVTIAPAIDGCATTAMLGPIEAISAPSMNIPDAAIQRLNAVEMLVRRAVTIGGNAIVNLRLENDNLGQVYATGDAISAIPMM